MTSRPYRPVGTIPTNAHYEKTSFQRFLSDPPRSFFKKLIVSTPRLLRNLHTMSLAKAAANAIATAEAMVVAAELATARDGCVGFGGGSDSGGNNDGSGQRTTTAQHTSILPLPGCKVLVLGRFPFISN